MSGTSTVTDNVSTDSRERWAALDRQHERLVDAADPLLAELRGDDADDDVLPAAS